MFLHVNFLAFAILALPCVILSCFTFSHLISFFLTVSYCVFSFTSLILSELSCPSLSLPDLLVFPFILSIYTPKTIALVAHGTHKSDPGPIWVHFIGWGYVGVGSSRPPESSLSIHRQIGRSIESHMRSRGSQLINEYSQWNVSGVGTRCSLTGARFLIVVPVTLLEQWRRELDTWVTRPTSLLMFSEFPVGDVSGTRGSQHRPRCSCNAWCSTWEKSCTTRSGVGLGERCRNGARKLSVEIAREADNDMIWYACLWFFGECCTL